MLTFGSSRAHRSMQCQPARQRPRHRSHRNYPNKAFVALQVRDAFARCVVGEAVRERRVWPSIRTLKQQYYNATNQACSCFGQRGVLSQWANVSPALDHARIAHRRALRRRPSIMQQPDESHAHLSFAGLSDDLSGGTTPGQRCGDDRFNVTPRGGIADRYRGVAGNFGQVGVASKLA